MNAAPAAVLGIPPAVNKKIEKSPYSLFLFDLLRFIPNEEKRIVLIDTSDPACPAF